MDAEAKGIHVLQKIDMGKEYIGDCISSDNLFIHLLGLCVQMQGDCVDSSFRVQL